MEGVAGSDQCQRERNEAGPAENQSRNEDDDGDRGEPHADAQDDVAAARERESRKCELARDGRGPDGQTRARRA